MARKHNQSPEARGILIKDFNNAPDFALFKQSTIAALLDCSEDKIERDRWLGIGIPFVKCSRNVRYRKKDVLEWLSAQKSVHSTTEAQTQAPI